MIPKKFIMPIVDNNLPFNAYQMRGFEFGCLLSCGKEVYPFLYSYFTNVFLYANGSKIDFTFDKGSWFDDYDVFHHKRIYLDDRAPSEWIDYLKANMADGNYAYGFFDEYYVPHKFSYNRQRFEHAFLLYGYDDEEGVFFAVGYTDSRKYESYKIPYKNFYDAFYSFRERRDWISIRHVNLDFSFTTNIELFYNELNEYLDSIYTGKDPIPGEIYGVNAMEEMINIIENRVVNHKQIDIRAGRFFAEYRSFMLSRLNYFREQEYMKKDYTERYTRLINLSQTAHLLIIKYNITANKNIGLKIVEILREVLYVEKNILMEVSNELKDYLYHSCS